MAMHHAQPGEIVDVRPLGSALADTRTRTLFKTSNVEAVRMVMQAGKEISEHEAPGEIVVQCLEGKIALTAVGRTRELEAGQLLYLAPEEPHSVRCIEDASFLLTILLNP